MYIEGPVTDSEPSAGAGVKLLLADEADPILVADSASRVALDGDLVAWAGSAEPVLDQPVFDEQVLTATLADLSPVVLSRPTSGMMGGRFPSAGDGLVAWNDSEFNANNLAVWDAASNRTFTVSRDGYFFLIAIGGGWITWAIESDATGPERELLRGLPVQEFEQAIGS